MPIHQANVAVNTVLANTDVLIDIPNENNVENQTATPVFKTRFLNWFKPSNYPLRLTDSATAALLYDTIISIISVSTEVNNFFSAGLPSIINGALSIAPTLFPFFPNLINTVYKMPDEEKNKPSESDNLDNKFEHLFLEANHLLVESRAENLEQLKKKLNEINLDVLKILADLRSYKESGVAGLYDNFINTVYLLTRAVGGILIILKSCHAESEAENDRLDEVNKWLSVVSNTAYLAYVFAHYIPRTNFFCFFKKNKSDEIKIPVINNVESINSGSADLHAPLLNTP